MPFSRGLLDPEIKPDISYVSCIGKESTCNAEDTGDQSSIPGSGRSPRELNGNPLQCSCLENPRDGKAWWAAIYGVAESRTNSRIPPQLEKNHVVPTAWQDEALARHGVSREVPCSALKFSFHGCNHHLQ